MVARAEQDVLGLDVAVDDPAPVGGVERGADLADEPRRPLGSSMPSRAHERAQVGPST